MSGDEQVFWWSSIDTRVRVLVDNMDSFVVGWLTGTITT
jgi:hypothetical protein